MARPLRIQYPGAYYHITCRGNERRKIFADGKDLSLFLEKLALSLEIYNVILLAYVCMRNHFHLVVKTPRGNLSEFMRHFNISYTTSYNHRHHRSGHLYQGRYKAFLIDADNYLRAVSRYVHLNPVRGKAAEGKSEEEKWRGLMKYRWSSLKGYLSPRERVGFLSCGDVLDHMGGDNHKGRERYGEFVRIGLKKELENPLELGKGHGVVGEDEFIESIKSKIGKWGEARREQPALRVLGRLLKPDELIEKFLRIVGRKKEEICRKGTQLPERGMLMELLYRFCNLPQPEIGRLIGGIDYSAVSQSRQRLRNALARDAGLKAKFDKIVSSLHEMSRIKI
ncbi:MAG: transposase [Candidatus Aureabacteria bacterium]|nr:transposase [Candidatus Auribacterota bacterium]